MNFQISFFNFQIVLGGRASTRAVRLAALLISSFIIHHSSFALSPATASITNLRSETSSAYVSPDEFFRGMPLLLTNCIAFAGSSTSAPRQDLSGLDLSLSIGTTESNISASAAASDPTNGTWWALISVPTNWDAPALQLKLSDSTNTFIYPWKIIKTKQPL